MFRKSASHGDVKKSAQKVADPKKDTVTRLKHLRTVLETYRYDVQEAKRFFQENYSHIYYIFYDNFSTIEADLKQRANKAHKEELESILIIFERILYLVPELIHKRWMFHSIGGILKKLLHPGNCIKLRREGMRLYVIWYQILQNNASEECHQIFVQLVPGLGEGTHQDALLNRVPTTPDSKFHYILFLSHGMIAAGEITPILPAIGEKVPENLTKYFLDALLACLVSEVVKIEWINKEMKENSFIFLFSKFKQFYLPWLLPDFQRSRDIYEPSLDLPRIRTMDEMGRLDYPANVSECRDSFILWLANFTLMSKKPSANSQNKSYFPPLLPDSHSTTSVTDEEKRESTEDQPDNAGPSRDATGIQYSEKDIVTIGHEEHSLSEYEIVRSVLFSTRENVNIVHECFRQALLFSFRHADAMRVVITVYKEWFQHVDKRPVFMCEPLSELELSVRDGSPNQLYSSLSDIVEEGSSDVLARQGLFPEVLDKPRYIRNASYLGAVQELADEGSENRQFDVRAGLQRILQVFITNSANIFLLETTDDSSLQEQVDLCKRVLNIYRYLVMHVTLNQNTWEQLLVVLLRVTSGVLKSSPPSERHKSLGGRLAQPIFQTLIVTWIKANLNVMIPVSLWNDFLQSLSSLTSWIEVVKEWAKTMETLTRVLANQVYGLHLNDLPLERLSEQKEKRKRGKGKDVHILELRSRSVSDKGFSRSWGRNESGSGLRGSTNSAPGAESPFERGKYRSDGSVKSRHELHKQRSLSGEPSPAHSRNGSDPSEIMIRSSSEGNIADPRELLEKLRVNASTTMIIFTGATAAMEDDEVARINTTSTCTAELTSGQYLQCTPDNNSLEKSDYDPLTSRGNCNSVNFLIKIFSYSEFHIIFLYDSCVVIDPTFQNTLCHFATSSRPPLAFLVYSTYAVMTSDIFLFLSLVSRTPSPVSMRSKSVSRTPSPTCEILPQKDSPTPDRDSLHIDMMAGADEDARPEDFNESRSVLSGGHVTGWMPDVAVVLWKRMIGCLGNINKIEDPAIHASVFEYLSDLQDTMFRMRENLGVTSDNMISPQPPILIPEQHKFISWLFECIKLDERYKEGKLFAYQLLCQIMIQRHDITPALDILSQYYYILHHGLLSSDQDVANVLIRNCGAKYFSCPLPASRLLMLDFIQAASSIITAMDVNEPPRAEAVSLLGCLICFPNHFQEMPVLKPNSVDRITLTCNDMKNHIIDSLLVAGKREPAGHARCIAVSSIGIFLYEELTHGTLHPKIKDGIDILLAALKCVNRKVAKVASDMLMLLCDHTDKLLNYHSHLPKKIVEVIVSTISGLLGHHENSSTEEEKRLIVLMMFNLIEWCIKIPIHLLMETTDTDKSCLYKVLHAAVTGHSSTSLPRSANSLSDFMSDSDFNNVTDSHSPTINSSPKSYASDSVLEEQILKTPDTPNVFDQPRQPPETDIVKLAARTLMKHLVNNLCHFPMGSGPARLNTLVQEHHDIPEYIEEDLKPDIFSAANVQFFVLNHRCLVSFIELPAKDAPGGGVTAGLTTAKTVCRVVVRDVGGKFCWESSVLYSPPWCKKDMELEPLIIQEDSDINIESSPSTRQLAPVPASSRTINTLPSYSTTGIQNGDDNLDDLLSFIGNTSPECLLRLGKPLNINPPIPEDLCDQAEGMMTTMVLDQRQAELEYYKQHKADVRQREIELMLAKPELPDEIEDPISPFQMCRMLLDQMGLMSWDKRCQFDLLKKTDKLLRELKNLDNQKCRETHKIAVIYVATGQEDKNSILSNTAGSRDYETFVAGLGWEVDLENHQGFLGGLQKNKTTGDTAPYYANSSCEVIFHVSTRMPVGTDESKHIKMRHLGNDEVHIVWSEHSRDYRRGIIPTEFGDIIIIIYPLPCGLYRIQINRKHEVPYFGPLFDGSIVDSKVLPGLVRATAVNASRIKRSLMPFFHSFYEERAKCLETIIQQNTEPTTFEDFAAYIFAPVLPTNSTSKSLHF
ncbi:hypothetical protein LOTGIDRAFT_210880 [Lottia gigantea]|uniref:Rap-GAP domain-containing protein n=1 Tax=Lottia gigantea TaxID=225164 RepID=V3ZXJ4_LOTGI|nr:hypothetical protein LOTGIDRAFT_210880 [Lottia gigantea]ESO85701.1 hypothetical protein LOTGIDRAFT_210880 [Lottia gigantea]